jgi:hypothetical protein
VRDGQELDLGNLKSELAVALSANIGGNLPSDRDQTKAGCRASATGGYKCAMVMLA